MIDAARRIRHALRLRTRLRERRERRFQRALAGPRLLREFGRAYPEACFIEIGANDGEQHDHLRPFVRSLPWRGVMVEPVPFVFERLRRNYADLDRVALENAAIADRDGELPFYHLAQAQDPQRDGLPGWYDGIGSLSREAVVEHGRAIPGIEDRIVRTMVPCLTFDSLCERHGIERVDLVLIDAEGYDWEIVRRLDLERRRPRVLVYEHFHLAPDERAAARSHLDRAGYVAFEEHFDTFCVDARVDDDLTRAWRAARPGLPGVSATGMAR